MINEIIIDNQVLKYQITYKNNKNTYFHFNKKGYIQINVSRYQSHKDIIEYIKSNSELFIKKYEKTQRNIIDENSYYYFGVKYEKVVDKDINNICFNHINEIVKIPNMNNDHIKQKYKEIETSLILEKLEKLKNKYIDNKYVNIADITFKTRYMKTRYGSCNSLKRSININIYLIHYDESYLEYVFLHEIAHLVHQNHSLDFYKLLSKLSNNYKQLKKELNNKYSYR